MTPLSRSSDATRRPGNSLLAAGLLIAVAAVLIGFHGTTMVLSAVSPSQKEQAEAGPGPLHSRTPAVAKSEPAAAGAEPSADRQTAPPPPTGIAAAAKAKALAEMDAMEPRDPEAEQAPAERPRRTYRARPVDKHKVY